MQARDAAGRQVSLLNDDSSSRFDNIHHHHLSFQHSSRPLLRPQAAHRSGSSSPDTPELLRSNSYDSQMSTDPISPLTPSVDYSYPRASIYSISHEYSSEGPPAKRQAYMDSSRAASCEDDSSAASSVPERTGKRYPCRYRDSHGCEKTFTTSGHASRHSKIHTAEKAVQCTYQGCHKKFTRADNMKQHLETHFKDKTRPSTNGQRTPKSSALTDARRSSTSSSRSRSSTAGGESANYWETNEHLQKQYPLPTPPLPHQAGTTGAAWDMRGLDLPLLNHPAGLSGTPNNGLDALAMAIACQESGRA
ncbi:Transcriptional regulator NRG1 [Cladobotryum mycophilum]|uniref:C2H2 type master regulator of conidiophore development brlA n=1 Tax=Cladobotryum mycophilum TaxID=491253 RepID=A0ABR0S650_9HYPO